MSSEFINHNILGLDFAEINQINHWLKERDAEVYEAQKNLDSFVGEETREKGDAWYNEVNSSYQIIFTPSSIGTVVTVRHHLTKKEFTLDRNY